MLDRVGEQFHQFIAPTRSLPLPPSLPPLFDAYNNPSHLHQHHLPLHHQQPNLLSPLHHKDEGEEEQQRGRIMSFEISEGEGGLGEHDELIDSTTWTDDEVLALLRIRSDLDTWFPHLTWEHVSRKLAEVGFKRSAEKCKEKFEEETSYLNSIHYTTKNSGYRFMSELEQLYQQQQQQLQEEEEEHEMAAGVGQLEVECEERKQAPENPAHQQQEEEEVKMDEALQKKRRTRGKRKREEDKLEIVRGCCEKMVKKMMEKQEEMQKKLLEEMVRRDEGIMARQEAWKKEEMEGINWELQLMAKEQAVAAQRQAAIIQLLNKISEQQQQGQYHYYYYDCSGSVSSDDDRNNNNNNNNNNPNCAAAAASLSSNSSSQNPNPSIIISNNKGENNNPDDQPPPPVVVNCASKGDKQEADCGGEGKTRATREKEEVGRRWPREEVMALIKVRSSSSSNNEGGGGSSRMNNNIPLWERISEGMRGMGYNRSAKRCKEKWENINKYFRKTHHLPKNVNRSLHSRTCPYFPQLTSFYSQHHH